MPECAARRTPLDEELAARGALPEELGVLAGRRAGPSRRLRRCGRGRRVCGPVLEEPEPLRPDDHEYTLFGDTIDELSGWYCFTEQYSEDQERWRRQADTNPILSQPYENPFKGVGRNDPCPCGSGKKFKKCSLQ